MAGSGQTQEKVRSNGVFRRAEKAFGQFLFEAEYAKQVRNAASFSSFNRLLVLVPSLSWQIIGRLI
jgi:hypothetical protein